ncbi:carbohydrate ABC transporter permease [Clostridium botulinum]|uniref:Carbohydrate ABC transporter permease n=1 Tax=Clostridium botulinum TaxID=1491 RepID=A0A6M0WVT5_CLOBO|nr:carbohydrate ABC transporter permease [Clostridium botulinum]KAI3350019.1 carbohydrate ABC transporter permease [Clostridium botulinum]MBN1075557.1 carbohydrate ABC transporter permease [Clostridium botulinum]MCS6111190.1 carbohydrate ABC transporter permease [Clostridium botulinum]NFE13510.1 carbohydrate ABC transporter permease [Clostridium botulinum]NFE60456.1 carbohydrate ABC transporter permease [Clostridium botulinum]
MVEGKLYRDNKMDLESIKSNISKRKVNYKKIVANMIRYIFIILASVIAFFPFLWMVSSALKVKDEVFLFPPKLIPSNPQWNNFIDVFKEAQFGQYMFNSFFTSFIEVAFQVFTAAMIAYALTLLEFRGKRLLFGVIMAIYMLPSAVTYVPCYILLSNLNLIDTLSGLIVSNLVSIFGIFLLRQAFLQVNKSLIEAARIDGASHFKILWKIVFPITKPTFITLILINFVTYYNDYMYPSLILKSPEKFLISSGLRQFFIEGGAYGIKWPQIMAASTITILPLLILFVIAQKWFMKGIGDTGVKE